MNKQHIEAIAKSAIPYYLRSAEHEGQRLLTEGHMLVLGAYDVLAKEDQRVTSLWKESLAPESGFLLTPEDVYHVADRYCRKLKCDQFELWLNEAYFQALTHEGCQLFSHGPKKNIRVRKDGSLVAVVMPVEAPGWDTKAVDVDLSNVFAKFACEANGWYLQPAGTATAKLREELAELEKSLREVERKISDLEDEQEEYEDDIRALKAKIAKTERSSEVAA